MSYNPFQPPGVPGVTAPAIEEEQQPDVFAPFRDPVWRETAKSAPAKAYLEFNQAMIKHPDWAGTTYDEKRKIYQGLFGADPLSIIGADDFKQMSDDEQRRAFNFAMAENTDWNSEGMTLEEKIDIRARALPKLYGPGAEVQRMREHMIANGDKLLNDIGIIMDQEKEAEWQEASAQVGELASILTDPEYVNAPIMERKSIFNKHSQNFDFYMNADVDTKKQIRDYFVQHEALPITREGFIADNPEGALETMTNAFNRGTKTVANGVATFLIAHELHQPDPKTMAGIAKFQDDIKGIPYNEASQRVMEGSADADDFIAWLWDNKANPDLWAWMGEVGTESMTMYGLTGGPLTMVGAVGGAPAAGAFAGSYLMEFGPGFLEALEKQGVDTTDPDALVKAAQNKELMRNARNYAAKHAVPVAAFDALAVGYFGAVGRSIAAMKAGGAVGGTAKKMGRYLRDLLVGGTLGMGGEVVGQIVRDGEITDPLGIFAEGVLDVGQSIPERSIAMGSPKLVEALAHPTVLPGEARMDFISERAEAGMREFGEEMGARTEYALVPSEGPEGKAGFVAVGPRGLSTERRDVSDNVRETIEQLPEGVQKRVWDIASALLNERANEAMDKAGITEPSQFPENELADIGDQALWDAFQDVKSEVEEATGKSIEEVMREAQRQREELAAAEPLAVPRMSMTQWNRIVKDAQSLEELDQIEGDFQQAEIIDRKRAKVEANIAAKRAELAKPPEIAPEAPVPAPTEEVTEVEAPEPEAEAEAPEVQPEPEPEPEPVAAPEPEAEVTAAELPPEYVYTEEQEARRAELMEEYESVNNMLQEAEEGSKEEANLIEKFAAIEGQLNEIDRVAREAVPEQADRRVDVERRTYVDALLNAAPTWMPEDSKRMWARGEIQDTQVIQEAFGEDVTEEQRVEAVNDIERARAKVDQRKPDLVTVPEEVQVEEAEVVPEVVEEEAAVEEEVKEAPKAAAKTAAALKKAIDDATTRAEVEAVVKGYQDDIDAGLRKKKAPSVVTKANKKMAALQEVITEAVAEEVAAEPAEAEVVEEKPKKPTKKAKIAQLKKDQATIEKELAQEQEPEDKASLEAELATVVAEREKLEAKKPVKEAKPRPSAAEATAMGRRRIEMDREIDAILNKMHKADTEEGRAAAEQELQTKQDEYVALIEEMERITLEDYKKEEKTARARRAGKVPKKRKKKAEPREKIDWPKTEEGRYATNIGEDAGGVAEAVRKAWWRENGLWVDIDPTFVDQALEEMRRDGVEFDGDLVRQALKEDIDESKGVHQYLDEVAPEANSLNEALIPVSQYEEWVAQTERARQDAAPERQKALEKMRDSKKHLTAERNEKAKDDKALEESKEMIDEAEKDLTLAEKEAADTKIVENDLTQDDIENADNELSLKIIEFGKKLKVFMAPLHTQLTPSFVHDAIERAQLERIRAAILTEVAKEAYRIEQEGRKPTTEEKARMDQWLQAADTLTAYTPKPDSYAEKLSKFMERRGVKMVFFSSTRGDSPVRGFNWPGIIGIHWDTNLQAVAQSLVHELTHQLRRVNPRAWARLSNYLKENFAGRWGEIEEVVRHTYADVVDGKMAYPPQDVIDREVVSFLGESQGEIILQAIADMDAMKTKPKGIKEIIDFVKKFFSDLAASVGLPVEIRPGDKATTGDLVARFAVSLEELHGAPRTEFGSEINLDDTITKLVAPELSIRPRGPGANPTASQRRAKSRARRLKQFTSHTRNVPKRAYDINVDRKSRINAARYRGRSARIEIQNIIKELGKKYSPESVFNALSALLDGRMPASQFQRIFGLTDDNPLYQTLSGLIDEKIALQQELSKMDLPEGLREVIRKGDYYQTRFYAVHILNHNYTPRQEDYDRAVDEVLELYTINFEKFLKSVERAAIKGMPFTIPEYLNANRAAQELMRGRVSKTRAAMLLALARDWDFWQQIARDKNLVGTVNDIIQMQDLMVLAQETVEGYLDSARSGSRSMRGPVRGMPIANLVNRKLTETFRELYGEITNPAERFARTMEVQGEIMAAMVMFQKIFEEGEGTWWTETKRGEFQHYLGAAEDRLTANDKKSYGSMAGKYVNKELYDLVHGTGILESKAFDNAILRWYSELQGVVRGTRLLWPKTIMRNGITSVTGFALRSGDLLYRPYVGHLLDGIELLSRLLKPSTKAGALKEVADIVEMGIFDAGHDSMLTAIEQDLYSAADPKKGISQLRQKFRDFMEAYAFVDLPAKYASYNTAITPKSEGGMGMTHEEAVEHVHKFYQYKDYNPEWIKKVNRLPIGDYFGYTYDSGRIAVNEMRHVYEESGKGNMKPLMGFMIGAGLPVMKYGGGGLLGLAVGAPLLTAFHAAVQQAIKKINLDDDEEEMYEILQDDEVAALRGAVPGFDQFMPLAAWRTKNKKTGKIKLHWDVLAGTSAYPIEDHVVGAIQSWRQYKARGADKSFTSIALSNLYSLSPLSPGMTLENVILKPLFGYDISRFRKSGTGIVDVMADAAQKYRTGKDMRPDWRAALFSKEFTGAIPDFLSGTVLPGQLGRVIKGAIELSSDRAPRIGSNEYRRVEDIGDLSHMIGGLVRGYTVDSEGQWNLLRNMTNIDFRNASEAKYMAGEAKREELSHEGEVPLHVLERSEKGRQAWYRALKSMEREVDNFRALTKDAYTDEQISERLRGFGNIRRGEAEAVASGTVDQLTDFETEPQPEPAQKGESFAIEYIKSSGKNFSYDELLRRMNARGFVVPDDRRKFVRWAKGLRRDLSRQGLLR
jgi:hypothetical protein